MILAKWDYKTHEYKPFESPAINPVLFENNLDSIKDCANCGKSMKFGDMFTSRTIHNPLGLGFGVCEVCYNEEFEKEKEVQRNGYKS